MNKAHLKRFTRLKYDVGCIVTLTFDGIYVEPDIHHILSGGRRIGHDATIPLSPWYHRGVPLDGMSKAAMTETFGPSLAYEKRAFVDRFGSEMELLEITNNVLRIRWGE